MDLRNRCPAIETIRPCGYRENARESVGLYFVGQEDLRDAVEMDECLIRSRRDCERVVR